MDETDVRRIATTAAFRAAGTILIALALAWLFALLAFPDAFARMGSSSMLNNEPALVDADDHTDALAASLLAAMLAVGACALAWSWWRSRAHVSR